ncbi:HlyC/CorC family transporter [Thalassotalea sp. LPB0316]|uniref:CNNM domain-containing protein n=1 Tax=Thalassotalea sp. LPB0316 TaxID=2769490 RepID=UPI001866527F|nr:hemolysin family protein [Thalassotalea sp. LPB0316]QOL25129.1 HlyC/CorC family transporter [Thalassotalea sp. LPB0316]
MSLLILYIVLAIGVSFLCSVLEAVLLSVNTAYITTLVNDDRPSGHLYKKWKDNVSQPLSAILTLNTIAHTIGAAGAGAQAAAVFGNAYLGVFSAILTLLILVFSEIIPKTIGAHYWRQLAPASAYILKYMVWALYPLIKMAEYLTSFFNNGENLSGFSREEFSAMVQVSSEEGQLEEQESQLLQNLLLVRTLKVKDAMTPRTVMFTLSETLLVEEYFHKYDKVFFSRIPVYRGDSDNIIGYVFRSDLLMAQARENGKQPLANYVRSIRAVPDKLPLNQVMDKLVEERSHIMLVVSEYGTVQGIITLEDVIETLLGFEIVDEKDRDVDMQKLARKLWRKRAEHKGVQLENDD